MAKASGKAVAILCSSGTAAVNFAPAVVEAFHSHVPLIVLTADRPPELQGLGSNQTIDQQNLYGSAAKWFVNMPLPEASDHMLRYVRMVADRGVSTAMQGAKGPAHLNFQFREPLLPAVMSTTTSGDSRPEEATRGPALAEMGWLAAEVLNKARGLIVCGPQHDVDAALSIQVLSGICEMPILADPVSQLRCGWDPNSTLGLYDNYLRDSLISESLKPDLILRFGAPPTSKALSTYLQRHADVRQVLISPGASWRDPDLTATAIFRAGIDEFCTSLLETLGSPDTRPPFRTDASWFPLWWKIESAARSAVAATLSEREEVSEPAVFHMLADALPASVSAEQLNSATVFAGNSMPVRDMDSFFPPTVKRVRCLANRGASGIDGVVSTALGAAAVSEGPTVLVIGDLSFYHDMNGLLAAQRFGLSATIVLINNDGGGIFSFLPQHEDAEHFETLFGTPHGLDFSHVAGLYGVDFQRVATREEYRNALKASFDAPGVQVIEIKTDREENLRLHQRIWDEVAKAVEPLGAEAARTGARQGDKP
jgi:2-succinyl-5-enolpyruvyl-6-hydroxy-3-cyclohexene-1-carboxylate synthase